MIGQNSVAPKKKKKKDPLIKKGLCLASVQPLSKRITEISIQKV